MVFHLAVTCLQVVFSAHGELVILISDHRIECGLRLMLFLIISINPQIEFLTG